MIQENTLLRSSAAVLLILVMLPVQAATQDQPSESYHLGIFPYMAHRQTVEFFGPVAANMENALNHSIKLETVQTFPEFGHELEKQHYDIALIQPFDYPKAVEKYGYLPLARLSVPLVSQIYVRDDSKYHDITDLRGSVIAMPPESAASSIMTIRALYDHNLFPGRDVEIRFFKSHDSCIQQVWAGNASACGTAKPPILVFEKRMQAKLRSVYDTPAIPHALFVVNPRVPDKQRDILQKLIIGWKNTQDGQKLLKNLGFPGFVKPNPSEYSKMHEYEQITQISEPTFTSSDKELIFGVLPFVGTRQLIKVFSPALPALSKAAGNNVNLRTASSFDNFNNGVASGTYDIAFIQPFDYAMATKHGYLPLAGMKDVLQSEFFVLENSNVKNISELKGKVVAMPPANAAVSHLGRHTLVMAGLHPGKDVTIDYRQTHASCLLQVHNKKAAACGTTHRVLKMVPDNLGQGLRSVGISEKIPGVVIMSHKRIPSGIRIKLQKEIISWNTSDYGRKILQSIHLGEFSVVNPGEYEKLSKFE